MTVDVRTADTCACGHAHSTHLRGGRGCRAKRCDCELFANVARVEFLRGLVRTYARELRAVERHLGLWVDVELTVDEVVRASNTSK